MLKEELSSVVLLVVSLAFQSTEGSNLYRLQNRQKVTTMKGGKGHNSIM